MTGTNLQALIDQAKRPSSSAEIVVVISNRPGVQGLKRASLAGIQTRVSIASSSPLSLFFPLVNVFVWPSQVVDHKLYGSRAEFDSTINTVLEEFGVELVCLAGFMRILTGTFVKKWTGMREQSNQFITELIFTALFLNLLSSRKAAEHPPISAALIQGRECSETGSPGRGESRWLHSPFCRRKYKP